MHLEKNWLDEIQNGHLSAIIHFSHGRYLVIHTRWLDHYYKTKCEIPGEDASWKIRLDQTQNGRLCAIIHFDMAVIW